MQSNRQVRMGLDLTLLRPDRMTGVERYAQNLALHLVEEAPEFEWHFFFRSPLPQAFQGLDKKAVLHVSSSGNRLWNDQAWLPWKARQARLDLLHAPAFPVSPAYRGRFVQTLHDCAMWRYPETLSRGARLYYKPLFPQSLRRAAALITDSQFSRSEILDLFDLPPERVHAILLGLDDAFVQAAPQTPREATPPFVLTVGTIEPRKNLDVLLRAFSQLPERHREVRLLLVGRQGWLDPARLGQLDPERVRWTGSLAEEKLIQLYQDAAVLALPSFYEGFGFPVLEAMSQGTAVLSSHAASLPEVGGEACRYAEPRDEAAWTQGLTELLDSAELRKELSLAGLERSRSFRWSEVARQTAAVYRSVLESPNPP